MKRGTCISVVKTADCQIRVVSVTAGQHPGRGYPRSNGWRSTTKRSKVQFGGCVWLGGGEDRPEWGTPPAPTRNWPDTLADANWSGQVARRRRRTRTDVPLRDMRPRVPSRTVALRRTGTSLSF